MAGSLAMSSKYFDRPQDLVLARQVAESCFLTYRHSVTGLGPENASFDAFNTEGTVFKVEPETFYSRYRSSQQYILRPGMVMSKLVVFLASLFHVILMCLDIWNHRGRDKEAIESLWILYRTTGEKKYQDQAWEMFQVRQTPGFLGQIFSTAIIWCAGLTSGRLSLSL